jgi:branched-chain amino acid transport system ATP-binding protein
MTSLLTVGGLAAGYGPVAVLHDVDLRVEAGQIVAVLGANGAGKTTLLRALSGLIRPTAGTLDLAGTPLIPVPVEERVRLGLAHVPEGQAVVAELTVDENLRLGGLWRRDRADAARARDEVYQLLPPLAARRRHAGHQLSGGERQLLAIGRALVARPRLLLLDEPCLGLAPLMTARVLALLRRLRDENGLAVVLVEQNVAAALSVADQGVLLAGGRVVLTGDAGTLRDSLLPTAGAPGDAALRHAYLGF